MVLKAMGNLLAPKAILFMGDLPKTGDAMVRAAFLGNALGDTSSPLNPKAVEEISKEI
jgi:hypothetical protein